MQNPINTVTKKVNHLIAGFIAAGIIFFLLSILIFWTDFMVKAVVGITVLLLAVIFIYSGVKIWIIKNDIQKILKF